MKKFLAGSTFYERPWLWKAALAAALPAGFGLRMINLKDPPLDFAGTHQLFSALKAHGMYYEYVTDIPEAPRRLWMGVQAPPLDGLGGLEAHPAGHFHIAGASAGEGCL